MSSSLDLEQGDAVPRDERLGEAIEAYLELAEEGRAPDPDAFAAGYPDLSEELREALAGLALVQGLVGDPQRAGGRLEAGRRVAGYKIVGELGRGGMGVVYDAVHVDLDRPVALKVLGTQSAPDGNGRRRFLNEARTAAGLHHTHIVPVFDVGQVGGLCYYAMQRIEGSGLERVVRRLRRERSTAAGSGGASTAATGRSRSRSPFSSRWRRPMTASDPAPAGPGSTATWAPGGGQRETADPLSFGGGSAGGRPGPPADEARLPVFGPPRGPAYFRWVAEVGRQAANALAYAHGRGVVHRDIKPSNLLVDARGTAWVADFGLARREADPGLTQSEGRLGTPRYMSPEQAEGRPVDARTDVYSLGATLYELLALRPPFEGATAADLTRQIVGKEATSPRQVDPQIPRDLETIVLKAMAKRPADRYASAAELADDLVRFLRHEPVKARRISPIGRAWRLARRHPASTGIAAAATALVLTVATVAYVRILQERDVALQAERDSDRQRAEAEGARADAHRALVRAYGREAALVRLSTLPDRRARGEGLLRDAAAIGPDAALRRALRDEGAELMALRDVGDRREIATGRVPNLAFGPGGQTLAALSENGETLRVWNVGAHALLCEQALRGDTDDAEARPEGPPPRNSFFAFFAGPRLAASGVEFAALRPDGRAVRFFDAATGTFARELPLAGNPARALVASADGHRLALVEKEGDDRDDPYHVTLRDAETAGEPLARLDIPADPAGPGSGRPLLVAFAPDGRALALGRSGESVVALFDAHDGHPLSNADGQPARIETTASLAALALGPFGQLATAGGGGLQLWDLTIQGNVATPTALPGLATQLGRVRALRFSADGSLLAASGLGSGVEIWDVAAGTLVAALPTADRVDDLAFAPGPDQPTLAASAGAVTAAWTVVEPVGFRRFAGFDLPFPPSLAFGPAGQMVMAGYREPLRIWDPAVRPLRVRTWDEVRPTAMAIDRSGYLAAADPEALTWYDLELAEPVGEIRLPRGNGPGPGPGRGNRVPAPLLAAVSADGRTLGLVRGRELLLWRAERPEAIERRPLPTNADRDRERGPNRERSPQFFTHLALAPDGRRTFLVLLDRGEPADSLGLAVDLAGDDPAALAWPPIAGVSALALGRGGRALALGLQTGEVLIVDPATGAARERLTALPESPDAPGADAAGAAPAEPDAVTALALAPAGDLLALATRGGPVQLWALGDEPVPLIRLPGHRGTISQLAFDAGGRRLASAGDDRQIVLWDLDLVREELNRLGLGW